MNTIPLNEAIALFPAAFTATVLDMRLYTGQPLALTEAWPITFRDELGNALRRMSPEHGASCGNTQCVYCRLFRPTAVQMTANGPRAQNLPPAIVLAETLPYWEDGICHPTMRITLVTGKTNDTDVVLQALAQVGMRGIGHPRVSCTACLLHQHTVSRDILHADAEQYRNCSHLRVHFITPTAITLRGKRQFGVTFTGLMEAILNRLHIGIAPHYGDMDIAKRTATERRALLTAAARIRTTATQLEWRHETRTRYRQRHQELSGFHGTIEYTGDFAPFWPLLLAATYTHIGNNTTFDRGRIALDAW